jgi:MFS family permease
MSKMFRWLIISQSVALLGSSLVFPFYLIFIKEVGASFTQFGLSYGLFTLSSAIVHKWIGRGTDRWGRKLFLIVSAWGMALVFLLFPMVSDVKQLYVLQVFMGILGAMQKTGEKAIVADFTDGQERGRLIGDYHFWSSIFAGVAIILGGVLIDFFTLEVIFYIGSVIMLVSGFLMLRVEQVSVK